MQFHVLGAQRDDKFQNLKKQKKKKFDYECVPNHVDILLFGPAGSGKSSLIKTWYRALYNKQELDMKMSEQLSIKKTNENEGTTLYSDFVIKEAEYTEESKALVGV